LHEDAQRLRAGSSAQVMTAIRDTVVAVLWFYGAEFVPTNQEDVVSAAGNF
jgi:hypothetical protein